MNVLLCCATLVTLFKSVAVQEEYMDTTSQASVATPPEIDDSMWKSQQQQQQQQYDDDQQQQQQYDDDESQYPLSEEEEKEEEGDTIPQEDSPSSSSPVNRLNRPTRSYNAIGSVSKAHAIGRHGAITTIATIRSVPLKVYHRPPPPIRILRRIPTTPLPQPYFDPSSPTNISAQLGMHAFLPCTIRNLNNNSISWIRTRDSHILTVDRYTFIADERFQSWHKEETETWTLQVKYVQERDAGRYECQISTEPKMSHFVHFQVVTPLVQIPGGPDIYVKSGSTVTLKCVISGALILPDYIFWYQGTDRVLAEHVSGGGQVFVERISDDTTIGTLIITTASPRDQGAYTCVPSSLPTASVTLHVLNAGEHPAAMHHGGGPKSHCPPPTSLLLFCLLAGCLLGERSTPSTFILSLLNLLPR